MPEIQIKLIQGSSFFWQKYNLFRNRNFVSMDFEQNTSKLLNNCVQQISSLPGIGKRTALRLTLHLLKEPPEDALKLSSAIAEMIHNIKFCKKCFNVTDHEECEICSHPKRNNKVICVVEDINDLMAIENTHQYFGVYHILGGLISPMDGIGPKDLKIQELIQRVQNDRIDEVIFALSSTTEGETTSFFLFRNLPENVKKSALARGVSFGNQLEYTDEITLGRSITQRLPYEDTLAH